MHEPFINIAIDAARVAENIIIKAIKRLDTIKISEKSPNDYVTDVDKQVEQAIIRVIHKAYPHHSILGEESGALTGSEDYQWIIDPIDGTRNFIHGFPHFAISIAISHKNKILHGVIYDPVRQELFTATRGKGAYLNDHRIRVSTRKHIKEALLGTGFAYRHSTDDPKPLGLLHAIIPHCGDIRRAGAATLDLAYIACGRLDGFWEFGLHIWDIAAGVLLVKEAGGMACDPLGGENHLKSGNIVAANSVLLRQLLKIIKPYAPPEE